MHVYVQTDERVQRVKTREAKEDTHTCIHTDTWHRAHSRPSTCCAKCCTAQRTFSSNSETPAETAPASSAASMSLPYRPCASTEAMSRLETQQLRTTIINSFVCVRARARVCACVRARVCVCLCVCFGGVGRGGQNLRGQRQSLSEVA